MSWTLEVDGANDSGLPRHPCREIASGIKLSLQRLILHLTLRNQRIHILQVPRQSTSLRVCCVVVATSLATRSYVHACNHVGSITKVSIDIQRAQHWKRAGLRELKPRVKGMLLNVSRVNRTVSLHSN